MKFKVQIKEIAQLGVKEEVSSESYKLKKPMQV